jgi:lysozyme
MTDYPITGIDVSRWQKEIQWENALAQGISFAFIKASDGYLADSRNIAALIDPQYERNMQETSKLGIPRGIYHFLRPGQNWKKQVELFSNLVNRSGIELDAIVDIERHDDINKYDLANIVEKFIKHTEDSIGRQLMIYTSAGFWNQYMPITGWAKHRRLWIASWTKGPQPTLPYEWEKPGKPWTFWQWSAKNQLGGSYGVATKSVDLNRFFGSQTDFFDMYKLSVLPIQIDQPTQDSTNGVIFEVIVPALHVFTTPDVNSAIVSDLELGDRITPTDIMGTDEVWLQIEPGKWVLFTYNGQKLMTRC